MKQISLWLNLIIKMGFLMPIIKDLILKKVEMCLFLNILNKDINELLPNRNDYKK